MAVKLTRKQTQGLEELYDAVWDINPTAAKQLLIWVNDPAIPIYPRTLTREKLHLRLSGLFSWRDYPGKELSWHLIYNQLL